MMSIREPLTYVCTWEALGYVASALVLAAFYMKEMIPLRIAALASNLAFIAYGAALGLTPIWLLHFLLLPMNGCRLVQALRVRRAHRQPRRTTPPALGNPNGRRGGTRSVATASKPSCRSGCRASCRGANRTGWRLPECGPVGYPSSEIGVAAHPFSAKAAIAPNGLSHTPTGQFLDGKEPPRPENTLVQPNAITPKVHDVRPPGHDNRRSPVRAPRAVSRGRGAIAESRSGASLHPTFATSSSASAPSESWCREMRAGSAARCRSCWAQSAQRRRERHRPTTRHGTCPAAKPPPRLSA